MLGEVPLDHHAIVALHEPLDACLVPFHLLFVDMHVEKPDKFADAFGVLGRRGFLTLQSDHATEKFCQHCDEIRLIALF